MDKHDLTARGTEGNTAPVIGKRGLSAKGKRGLTAKGKRGLTAKGKRGLIARGTEGNKAP